MIENNLRANRPTVRPVRTPDYRVVQLELARYHLAWTRQQWATVLVTAKFRSARFFQNGRIRVWRETVPRCHSDWARSLLCLIHLGVGDETDLQTPFHRVQVYQDSMLQSLVVPPLQVIGTSAIFPDDNARPHRTKVVNEFQQQHHVNQMVWPTYSPDLNPIEPVWDVRRRTDSHPQQLTSTGCTNFCSNSGQPFLSIMQRCPVQFQWLAYLILTVIVCDFSEF